MAAARRALRAMTPFTHVVESVEELRELVGTPAARSVLKERNELDHHDRAFIALSPAWAEPPVLRHLYPAAGGQGTSVSVTASGTFKPWRTHSA